MGTNFYLRSEICGHCDHAKKEQHIGKRSGGWKFTWRGYRDDVPPVTSKKDWAALFQAPGVQIKDEYGQKYTPQEFLDMVDAWDANPKNTHTHYAYVRDPANSRGVPYQRFIDESWMDAEGYNFVGGEFS